MFFYTTYYPKSKFCGMEVGESLFNNPYLQKNPEVFTNIILNNDELKRRFEHVLGYRYHVDFTQEYDQTVELDWDSFSLDDLIKKYKGYIAQGRNDNYGVACLLCEIIWAYDRVRFIPTTNPTAERPSMTLDLTPSAPYLILYMPSQFRSSDEEMSLSTPSEVQKILLKYVKMLTGDDNLDKMGCGIHYGIPIENEYDCIYSEGHYEKIAHAVDAMNSKGAKDHHGITYGMLDIISLIASEYRKFRRVEISLCGFVSVITDDIQKILDLISEVRSLVTDRLTEEDINNTFMDCLVKKNEFNSPYMRFLNGAEIKIDNYVVSLKDYKWEHSNCHDKFDLADLY